MPIVIRELVITASVDASAQNATSPASAPPAGETQAALVAECVAQVLAVLAEREER